MNIVTNIGNLRPLLLKLIDQGCSRRILVRVAGVKCFDTLSIPAFLRTALTQPQVTWKFDAIRMTATALYESDETMNAAMKTLSNQHKIVYALVTKREPNSSMTWYDSKTEQTYVFKADDFGNVLFYIGETEVSMKERARQHGVWARQSKRFGSNSKKDYLLYRFMEANNIVFTCTPIVADGTMSEDEVVSCARALGHTLMNTCKANTNRKLDIVQTLRLTKGIQ